MVQIAGASSASFCCIYAVIQLMNVSSIYVTSVLLVYHSCMIVYHSCITACDDDW